MAKRPTIPMPRTCRGNVIPSGRYHAGTWLEDESFCYPHGGKTRRARVVCVSDGKLRVVKCGLPDTFFSVPVAGGGIITDVNGILTYDDRTFLACAQIRNFLNRNPRPGSKHKWTKEQREDLRVCVNDLVIQGFQFTLENIQILTFTHDSKDNEACVETIGGWMAEHHAAMENLNNLLNVVYSGSEAPLHIY